MLVSSDARSLPTRSSTPLLAGVSTAMRAIARWCVSAPWLPMAKPAVEGRKSARDEMPTSEEGIMGKCDNMNATRQAPAHTPGPDEGNRAPHHI